MFIRVIWMVIIIINSCLCSLYCTKCAWTVTSSDKTYQLNLTKFQNIGLNLTAQDSGDLYYYSICNNMVGINEYGYFQQYMAARVTNQGEAYYLAQFNASIQPTIRFDKKSNIIWNFQYNYNFSVEYICDENIADRPYMEITQILEVFPNSYLIEISSAYICNNATAPSYIDKNECIWIDSSTNSILDLSPLYGECIKKSGTTQSYRYCICQNDLYFLYADTASFCGMYGYDSNNYKSESVKIFWDTSIQPIFNDSAVPSSWTFEYPPFSYASTNNIVIIEWICVPSITLQIKSATSDFMSIQSKYACPAQCIFIDNENNENKLNLRSIMGDNLEFIDDDRKYSFLYTPCSNNIMCNNNAVMAIKWDIEKRECDSNLAIWDGVDDGYTLNYSQFTHEWEFVYKNGGQCITDPQSSIQLRIYWTCNVNVSKWNITNAATITQCEYEMYIDSILAC